MRSRPHQHEGSLSGLSCTATGGVHCIMPRSRLPNFQPPTLVIKGGSLQLCLWVNKDREAGVQPMYKWRCTVMFVQMLRGIKILERHLISLKPLQAFTFHRRIFWSESSFSPFPFTWGFVCWFTLRLESKTHPIRDLSTSGKNCFGPAAPHQGSFKT